jgi:mannose/cellobiose epimerase-like protein (N-acyl-D-glucosamine 2-epimerase family)
VLDYNAENKKDQFRPYGTTPGHGLEWSRLLLEARAGLGEAAPEWMLGAGRELFARAVQDGWAPDGEPGFVYTVGWDGQPVVTERLHWVVAEGVGAAATLYRATGDESYARQYAAWWDYIDADVLDIEAGSWHHELDPHGRVSRTIWNGKPDAYHAVQATLIPRLPLTPALAPALAAGLLDKA